MTGILLLLAFPAPQTLARFPDGWEAESQATRCLEHLGRIAALRHLHGHQGGAWDRAREETLSRLEYWLALELCHKAAGWDAEAPVRLRLEQLKQRIGPERFLAGWRPPLMPACEPDPVDVVGPLPPNAAGR